MDARARYEAGRSARSREVDAYEARSRSLGFFRLALAAGAIVLTGAMVWAALPQRAWLGVAALVVGFVTLVVVHARVIAAKDRAVCALRVFIFAAFY